MFEQAFRNIDDVLRKEAGCTTELDYTEQTSWLLFLKYLDGLEQDRADEAALNGKKYSFILDKAYRCESRAAPRFHNKGIPSLFDHHVCYFFRRQGTLSLSPIPTTIRWRRSSSAIIAARAHAGGAKPRPIDVAGHLVRDYAV